MLRNLLLGIFSLFLCSSAIAQTTFEPSPAPLNIRTVDGATTTYPYSLMVTNGTLVDNGNGTATLNTGGGGGGSGTPGLPLDSVQFNAGGFAGSSNFIYHSTSATLTVTGPILSTSYGRFDGGILSSGAVLGFTIPTGVGVRLMWIPSFGAFRAGYPSATSWNTANLGYYSFAVGQGTIASGTRSFAQGNSSTASGQESMAIGSSTIASGNQSFAGGLQTTASGQYSMAWGGIDTTASALGSSAFGLASIASGTGSFSVGSRTEASGQGALAAGHNGNAIHNFIAGTGTADVGYGQIALGYVSAGHTLKAEGSGSVAIGQDVNALTSNNVLVFGRDFTSSQADSFNIGFGQQDYNFTANQADFYNSAISTTNVASASVLYATNAVITTGTATSSVLGVTTSAIINKYIQMAGQTTVGSPPAGSARLHARTVSGFTRFEQDNESATNVVLGRDNVILCKNVTGLSMTPGQVVYVSGVTAGIPEVQLARANSLSTLPALGIVMDTITSTSIGQILQSGIVTMDTSAFSTGDKVWVSTTTAGGLQNTRPSGTSGVFVQKVGVVITQGVSGALVLQLASTIGNMETGTVSNFTSSGSIIATNIGATSRVQATGAIVTAGTSTSAVVSVTATGGNYYLPYRDGSTGQVITLQTDGTSVWQSPSTSSGGGHTIQDEGVSLTQRTKLNFVGAGVTVTDGGAGTDDTIVTIPGGGASSSSGSVVAIFDGGGSAIASGSVAWARLPFAATITEWTLTSYATCPTLVIDVSKSTYDNYDPNYGTSIDGTEIPTLTNQRKNRDTYLTTWTTSITAGDFVYFKVIGVDTATYAVLTIGYTK
jgi:hypothetical protein